MSYEPSQELEQLLTDLSDGDLSAEQEARLTELLRQDREARGYYLDFMMMQTSLRWEYASAATDTDTDTDTGGASVGEPDADVIGRIDWRRSWWRYAVVAAVAIAATSISMALWSGWGRQPEQNTVARVTDLDAPDWGDGRRLAAGQRVTPGLLELRSGRAELTFDSGARLTIAGPALLDVRSDKVVDLSAGAVSVYAPEEAVGFTLRTPSSDYVDLGTEFGVVVDEDQSSEVHVFDGVVIARPRESSVVVPVLRDEAGRVEPDRGDIVSVRTDMSRFPWIAARQTQGASSDATPAAGRYEPIRAGSRVVFLGDRTTDRETHQMLIEQALRTVADGESIRLINAGVAMPLHFDERQFERYVLAHRPTHAVIEFGSEIALHPASERLSPEAFAERVTRLVDRLVSAGIEPIVATAYPLTERHPESMRAVERYNEFLRRLAQDRGYRLAEVAQRFYDAKVDVHLLLGSNDTIPWFEGHREIAIAELAAFGYPRVEVAHSLDLSLLPGVVTEWRVRVKPETSELTDAGAALLEADGTWGRLTLPQEDPFSRRAAYRSHSISYRDRARGFATDLFQGDDQLVEAIATLESGAARDVYLNVGAGVRRVWLNGERIYDNERWTGWHAGKDRIAVTLRAGVNRIVIESGDTFFVSVTDGRDWPLTPRTKGRRGR